MGGGANIPKPKLSRKLLASFLLVGLLPVVIAGCVLSIVALNQLHQDANAKQQAIANQLSGRVDDYLNKDTGSLLYIAKLYTSYPNLLDQSLSTLLKQDSSLEKVDVLTTNGDKKTATLNSGQLQIVTSKIDSSDTTLDQLSGKSKMLSVGRDGSNNPLVTIGLPITPVSGSTKIIGGIIGYFNSVDLTKSLPTSGLGQGGYTYVVDSSGNLVTHPDLGFLQAHIQISDIPAVAGFLGGTYQTKQTNSENGDDVLSTSSNTLSGFGVIVEEPTEQVYASYTWYMQLAIGVGIAAIILCVLAGLFFKTKFARPIRRLALGAQRITQKDFSQKIDISSKDELQDIAAAFNSIGSDIDKLVTDQKSNNMSLTFEQSKLSNIINSVSDGVIAVDRYGNTISLNPPAAKLFNQMPMHLKGKHVTDYFNPTHDGSLLKFDFKEPGIYSYTDLMLNLGEKTTYLDIMIAVLESHDNDVAAIITIHDQTASRELSFMKLDFVAIAAHELRTPLTVISGYLDLLNNEAIKELSVLNIENLQKAIVGTNQLRELINKLLNIARIERGDMEIFIDKLNITQLVQKNVEQHMTVAAQKEQTLSYTSNAKGSVYVPADTASIVEVLNNLIGNALKYTPKGGRIQVNVTTASDHVRVDILDTGPGVPTDLREKLFTKFYRAERSLIAGTRGTGLGLFISKTIIELQHGVIGIEEDKGNGSIFYFTLPTYNSERDDGLIEKNISGGIHGWFKKRTPR
ncbi:MAG: cell wall metabolism sensor histidine kinase WalK [Candidatus Saccharibacteria bacterium]|nr:cell wall metabolism sensor histidine kinase WalK [Candidatus Saccharibacteria bacterium]